MLIFRGRSFPGTGKFCILQASAIFKPFRFDFWFQLILRVSMSHFKIISHLNLFTQKRVLLRITKQGSRLKKQTQRQRCPIKVTEFRAKIGYRDQIFDIKNRFWYSIREKFELKNIPKKEKNEIDFKLYQEQLQKLSKMANFWNRFLKLVKIWSCDVLYICCNVCRYYFCYHFICIIICHIEMETGQ